MAAALGCAGVIALVAAVISLVAYLFMLLWNAVVPALFHGPVLSFWMALGLWVLLGMIGNLFRSNNSKS